MQKAERRNWTVPFQLRNTALGLSAALLVLVDSTAARAQGCAMCYNTAAAAKATAIQALRSGILILLVPVALMFIGIFVLAFRSAERFSESKFETRNPKLETGGSLEDGKSAVRREFGVSKFEFPEHQGSFLEERTQQQ